MKKYNLEQDHKEIKEQIKEWQQKINLVIACLTENKTKRINSHNECLNDLKKISHEMMAINI